VILEGEKEKGKGKYLISSTSSRSQNWPSLVEPSSAAQQAL